MKTIFKWTTLVVLTGMLLAIGYVSIFLFPLISGFGAKILCTCTFVGGQNEADVRKHELGTFPVSLGSFSLDIEDSSAVGSVIGTARKKAIYRKGLGCTLVNEIAEEELRAQSIKINRATGYNADTVFWPLGNKDAESPGDYKQLKDVVYQAFEDPSGKGLRNMRAILVVYDGKIVAEQYGPGFDKNSRQHGWSMTKSLFNNSMVGILTRQQRMKPLAADYIKEWANDSRSQITIDNLMHSSSGLAWDESYGGKSDVTTMLYSKNNMGDFASSKEVKDPAGSTFRYSSGTANVLSMIIRTELGDDYHNYPYRELYDKIGMSSLIIEPDAAGTFVSSSYSMATARDWARFGLFYLNNGKIGDEQILPESWVQYSCTPDRGAVYGEYGAQFWLNAGSKEYPDVREFPSAPNDMYWADGYRGQRLFIIPSKKLVIVKLCYSTGDYLYEDEFLDRVFKSIDQELQAQNRSSIR